MYTGANDSSPCASHRVQLRHVLLPHPGASETTEETAESHQRGACEASNA